MSKYNKLILISGILASASFAAPACPPVSSKHPAKTLYQQLCDPQESKAKQEKQQQQRSQQRAQQLAMEPQPAVPVSNITPTIKLKAPKPQGQVGYRLPKPFVPPKPVNPFQNMQKQQKPVPQSKTNMPPKTSQSSPQSPWSYLE